MLPGDSASGVWALPCVFMRTPQSGFCPAEALHFQISPAWSFSYVCQPVRKLHLLRTRGSQIRSPRSKTCHSGNPRSEAKVKSRGGFLCVMVSVGGTVLPEVPELE